MREKKKKEYIYGLLTLYERGRKFCISFRNPASELLGEPTNQTQNPTFTINLFTLVIYTFTLVVTILKYEL